MSDVWESEGGRVEEDLDDATIREMARRIKSSMLDAEDNLAIAKTRLKNLQKRCSHPNKYRYSAMGELGWKCPDCFWSK